MSEVSRRTFLKSGSAAMVAVGAISAIPGLPALAGALETQGPADAGTPTRRRPMSVPRSTPPPPRASPWSHTSATWPPGRSAFSPGQRGDHRASIPNWPPD